MGRSSRRRSQRGLLLVAASAAVGLLLSGCATGAAKNADGPTVSLPTSSAPTSQTPSDSTSAAPTSETPPTTSAAPSSAAPTSEAPPVNQPTTVYTKAAASISTGENAKVSITVQTPNPGVPFGDVTLVVDGAGYATATLNAAGTMAFTVKGLADGDHTYYAKYAGNESFLANQSKAKSLHVLSAAEIAAAKKKKEDEAAAAAANPCPAKAEACVDLTSNTTWLQKDGVVTAGPFKQIAGRDGHRTPPGTYTVQWKDIDHLSKEFDNAPMPYSIFFNGEGMAFHVGSLSNPSHGCVHLSESAAKTYWDALQPGDVVYIYGSPQY